MGTTRTFRRALGPVVLVGALSLVAGAAAASGAPALLPRPIDKAEECLAASPAAASVAGVLDDGREVFLDVHVLLDGVTQERGAEVIRQAQQAYTPLKVTLRATFQEIAIEAQRMEPRFGEGPIGGGDMQPTSDADYMFEKAREAVGGVRPPHADVVYLLSSDRITGTVAGMADCIGGVRYPNRAFAIGEEEPDGDGEGVSLCCTWTTAKIAAHEIAHLMGAHHHYANCVEGTPTAAADRHAGTCTLMFNDVGLVNLHTSTLEGAVVRGYAVEYADGASAPPPQPGAYSRSVTLDLSKHLVARGSLTAGGAESCIEGAGIAIERKLAGAWQEVATGTASGSGSYRLKVVDEPGRYRAVVAESTFSDESGTYVCNVAASSPVRHAHP